MDNLQKVKSLLSISTLNDSIPDLLLRVLDLVEGAQTIGLARRISDTDRFQVSTLAGEAGSLRGFTFDTGEGFLGHVAATGQPAYWTDMIHDPRSAPYVERGIAANSISCYPVVQGHQVIVVLFTIWSGESQKDAFELMDVFLGIIGRQVLVDVLGDSLQTNTKRLSSIMELSQAMMAVEEIKNVLYILLDMSLNLTQGPYSCIVFKQSRRDSRIEVLSRGISQKTANEIGRILADMYIGRNLGEIEEHGIPVVHRHESIQHIECPMYLRNEVMAVLTVAVSASSKTEEFSQLLYVLSVMGNAALQRISTGHRQELSRDIELIHRTAQHWTKDARDEALDIRETATAFARHLELPEHIIETIGHAAMLSVFDIEFVTGLLPDMDDELSYMLTERLALHKASGMAMGVFSKGSQILVLSEHYHRKTKFRLSGVDSDLRDQFDLFVLRKDAQLQALPVCDVGKRKDTDSVQLSEASDCDTLTGREREVLELLTRGKGNREIAQSLFISEHTVKNHLTNIFQKLGVNDRMQAVAYVHHHL